MSIYDKSAKLIAGIQKEIASGKITTESGDARIARYRAKGPVYRVKGYAYGKHYDLEVPSNAGSIKAAREFDARMKLNITDKIFSPTDLMRTRLAKIFEAHLKAQAGRGGEGSARTRCKHAMSAFGHITLEKLHNNPAGILEAGFNTMPKDWSKKTVWLLWSFMKSAIEKFLSLNPKIQINNPVTAYPMSHGTVNREVYPTEFEHLTVVSHLQANPFQWVTREGRGPMKSGYPIYLAALMVCKYEQGLRGMEIVGWRFEHLDLDRLEGKLPAVKTKILKKGRRQWQWVVLTPASYRAMRKYLDTVHGQKEYGPVWPIKNWPTKLVRRALDICGLGHLWAHDWRRAWTMAHIDQPGERRRAAIGKETETGEAPYIHFNRGEQEKLYAEKWAEFEGEK